VTPRMRRKANAARRKARHATRCPKRPGALLLRVLHDAGCKAPLYPCTCRPDYAIHVDPDARTFAASSAAQDDRVAEIRKTLS
jgi:hypothetical protein